MSVGPPAGGSASPPTPGDRGSQVSAVLEMLEASKDYWRVRRAVKEAVVKPAMRLSNAADFERDVRRLMEDSGLANRLRNFAFNARHRIPDHLAARTERAHRTTPSTAPSRVGTSETHARDDASWSDGSDEEDAREAAGTSSSVIAARRAWRDEVRARLVHLSASTGVPLSEPGRDPARDASEEHEGRRGRGKKQTDGRELDAPESALERAAFTASLPRLAGHAYDHRDLLRIVAAFRARADTDADARDDRAPKRSEERRSPRGDARPAKPGVPPLPPVPWFLARGFPTGAPPRRAALRAFLCELAPDRRQAGVDEAWHSAFAARRTAEAESVLARRPTNANAPPSETAGRAAYRAFLRGGAPAALRARLWHLALGAGEARVGDTHHPDLDFAREDFDRACDEARETRLLTDALCASDVRAFCDHPHFFPFEETMRAVAVAFSRDRDVPASCARAGSGLSSSRPPHPRAYAATRSEKAEKENVAGEDQRRFSKTRLGRDAFATLYPPSGVVPFKGLARLIAPLCYLYPNPADVHGVFKRLYARLFKKLHAIDDDAFPSPAFPGLLALFEDALFRAEPELCFHLAEIGCPAARLAAPWIFGAFAGYLSVEETLLLWDRAIGFDSLVPLALAAAAVAALRKPALLAATREEEARECLEDLSEVKVAPLLQEFVFRETLDAAFESDEDEDEDEDESGAFESEAADVDDF